MHGSAIHPPWRNSKRLELGRYPHKPVFVHKLLCQDTVEERIHKLQQEKVKLAAGLLADADISNKLNASMVRALLEE